jgi:hypothetical protein
MTGQVKIARLRIRVPAEHAAAPKRLAADVARYLAEPGTDWGRSRVDSVRTKVTATGSADGLARNIAKAVHKSIRQRGEN